MEALPFKYFIPLLIIAALIAANALLKRRLQGSAEKVMYKNLTMIVLTICAALGIAFIFADSDKNREYILGVFGIFLSAAVALSSTTLLGNALAGMMLRSVRSFKLGDFIRVNEFFGSVSGRGLFHTEIQNEDNDLVTLPNLYLATHPVQVTLKSGTIIAADVNLDYGVPREKIEKLLTRAAEAAGLQNASIHVMSLVGYGVTYRVRGNLVDINRVSPPEARSHLNIMILEFLKAEMIEIVSPAFTNKRSAVRRKSSAGSRKTLPKIKLQDSKDQTTFGIARKAAKQSELAEEQEQLARELRDLEAQLAETRAPGEIESLKHKISRRQQLLELVEAKIKQLGEEIDSEKGG